MGSSADAGWQFVKMAASLVSATPDAVVDAVRGSLSDGAGPWAGETVLLRSRDVSVNILGASETLKELVLTEDSLGLDIEVDEGFFRRSRRRDRYPLSQVVVSDGVPCVEAKRKFFVWYLCITFKGESLELSFENDSERLARVWAEEIRQCVVRIREVRREARRREKQLALEREAAERRSGGKVVVGKCRACHAPLSGAEGRVVRCAYCDTKQSL